MLDCADVPLAWREAIAIGCYLHLRPGEIHELRVSDLDLDAGEAKIRRAYDEREKVVKPPKTEEGIRHITIPTTLLPLLRRIERERAPNDLVAPIVSATPEKNRAGFFRDFLRAANVTRVELFVETETHLRIDFRSLRDSGITWRFLAEHRAEVIQRESGHEHVGTTLGYAKEVQDRRGRYGTPFPALPNDLTKGVRPPHSSEQSSAETQRARIAGSSWSGRRDLNPRSQAPKACALPVCATPRRSGTSYHALPRSPIAPVR